MPSNDKYGKHTDFNGFVIMVPEYIPGMAGGYDEVKIKHVVETLPIPEPGGCDLCMPGTAVYVVKSPNIMDGTQCALLQCQSCTRDSANAMDNPDEWLNPQA